MKRFFIIGFLILLAFDTMAQVGFKLAATHTAPAAFELAWFLRVITEGWIYAAVLGYIGAFVTYMTLLKHADIGPAFAATHMEIVTVTLVSVFFLGEHLSMPQIAGGLLIMGGIWLLGTEKDKDAQGAEAGRSGQTEQLAAPERSFVDVS